MKWLTENLGLKILALALAIVLYLSLKNDAPKNGRLSLTSNHDRQQTTTQR